MHLFNDGNQATSFSQKTVMFLKDGTKGASRTPRGHSRPLESQALNSKEILENPNDPQPSRCPKDSLNRQLVHGKSEPDSGFVIPPENQPSINMGDIMSEKQLISSFRPRYELPVCSMALLPPFSTSFLGYFELIMVCFPTNPY